MAREKRNNGMKKIAMFLGVFATLLLGSMSQSSYALTLNSIPDFNAAPVTVNYTSGAFSAYGDVEKFNGSNVTGINFYMLAAIDSLGNLTAGFMSIYNQSSFLIQGDLTKLDFTSGDPVLNFLFTPTGGLYQSAYGSLGGIILGASGLSINGFGSDFSTFSASADVGTPVPEPSSVCLLLLGAGGLIFVRRRKS